MEQTSPPKARVAVDESDPNGDIARAGVLRKGKKGKDFYAVLWAEPLSGTKHARLELYADEKTFHKQKPPKKMILVVDIAAVYRSDTGSEGQNAFSIMLTDQDRIYFHTASTDDKDLWVGILLEFVTRQPNARRLGYDWQFNKLEVCAKELGQVTGLAVVKPIKCSVAFNATDFAVLYQLRHKPRFVCPIRALRSCGYNNDIMYIHCGRRAPCGEGKLYFKAESEAIARHVKDSLYGEMCRGVTLTKSGSVSASPPVAGVGMHIRTQSSSGSIQNYVQDPPLQRSAQSYTDGFAVPEQCKGHRPRAEAISNGVKQFSRQMSDPHCGMRINSLQRSQTCRGHRNSSGENVHLEGSMPNPGYVSSKPEIMPGYEDMSNSTFPREEDYEDMSALGRSFSSRSSLRDSRSSFDGSRASLDMSHASFEGSRTGEYENIMPNSVSRSYSSPRNSIPASLNGLDAHMSSLSMRSDERMYQNIDPHKFGTRFFVVPGSENSEVINRGESSSQVPSAPISMPPRRTSMRSLNEEHSGSLVSQSWHNPPYPADKPEEMFVMDGLPSGTPSPPLVKRQSNVEMPARTVIANS